MLLISIFNAAGGSSDKIGPDNVETFRDVMLISVVGIGGLSSLIFHIIIKPSSEVSKKVGTENLYFHTLLHLRLYLFYYVHYSL